MSTISLLFFSLFLLLSEFPAKAENVSFNFTSFSFLNLTLLGDAYLRNGSVIGLSSETDVPSSSSGTAICSLPIQFFDPRMNISASFSTSFSFAVMNQNPGTYGDGLTFFISGDNATLGSAGGYLGLFNSSTPEDGSIIAIEFDTLLNQEFDDPSDNHVGLDIGSPASVISVDLGSFDIDLKNGKLINVWIEYHQGDRNLKVWLGYEDVKPRDPVLSTNFDLSKHFVEYMFVGFSASTEGSTEVHTIEDWSFQTFGFPTSNLSVETPPLNLSSSSYLDVNPIIPMANNGSNSNKKKLSLGLAIICPVAVGVAFIALLWLSFRRWIEFRAKKDRSGSELLKGPRKFSYRELIIATKGFHSSRVIGNGAFGTVYKAIAPGVGVPYAVKRSKQAHLSKDEFVAELSIIACLRHKNLVQLQGWCTEKNELLLVYEYMSNGSLDEVLYRGHELTESSSTLQWPQRNNIAVGIASVLAYLHQECEQQVIHRDIKTSNILLDANFYPRLGDFGLARLMDHNKSPVSTLTAGTMGYLAPEYLQYGTATEKTDVFSYGVVILEVCCGRRPIDAKDSNRKMINLVDWVWALRAEDRLAEAADPRLNGKFDEKEMVRLLLVGLSCAHPNCEERPSMRRVLQILNSEAEPIAVPKRKPLLTFTSAVSLSMKEIVSDLEIV